MNSHRSGSAHALARTELLTRECKPRVFPEVTHEHLASCIVAVGTVDREGTLFATDGASIQALDRLDATEVVARRPALKQFWKDALWWTVDAADQSQESCIVRSNGDEQCWACVVRNEHKSDLLRFAILQSQRIGCIEIDPLWVSIFERLNPGSEKA